MLHEVNHWREGQDPVTNEIKGQKIMSPTES